jgi:uncharacterized membrane protein
VNFPADLFPPPWPAVAWLPLLVALGWSVLRVPWRKLAEGRRFHVLAGTVVALMLLWSLQAGVKPGLSYHLLGATVAALMFGPHLGAIALSLVLAAATLNGDAGWSAFALNALSMVLWPVWLAFGVFWIVDRYLPNHLFVYLIVDAFLGAALSVAGAGAGASMLLGLAGVYPADYLVGEYLPPYLLLAFSEAWLSGTAITLMVVYHPDWVSTFDDRRYILNK